MTAPSIPFREPLARTLTRTVGIAVVGGAVLSFAWSGGLSRWAVATLLMMWPSFGGHWLEVLFLNGLRPRMPRGRAVQITARLTVWFIGGVVILVAVQATAYALSVVRTSQWPLWAGGLGMIAVELVAHLPMAVRGAPSFYDGRG